MFEINMDSGERQLLKQQEVKDFTLKSIAVNVFGLPHLMV